MPDDTHKSREELLLEVRELREKLAMACSSRSPDPDWQSLPESLDHIPADMDPKTKSITKSDATLQSLFRAAPLGISILRNRIFQWVNHRLAAMLDYSPEDMRGMPSHALYENDEEYVRVGQLLYTNAISFSFETVESRWRCKNGAFIDVLLNMAALYPDALNEGVIVTALDITERKRTEQALKENQRQLATLMSNLPGMAYRCENDAHWTMRFLSEGCQALTGYNPQDLLDNQELSYGSLIHPDDRDSVWKQVQRTIISGDPFAMSYRITDAQGKVRWVWEQGRAVFNADGAVEALEGFIIDISQRKKAEDERQKLEAQVQHAQKLESLGVLAGGIAHDFNNLLMGILGNADMALQDLSPASPARDTIRDIEKAARRAADLARQMLAYSGKGRFVIEHINLTEVVEEMSHLLEISISKKAILKYHFSRDISSIEADVSQLRQIIMNLITNASEAIGDRSGVITISTGIIHCDQTYLQQTYLDDALPTGPYVYVEVTDNGCGMSEETRSRIFDPFFTTKFTGRGLGLAAVLGIVRGHHGAIKVYSEPGQGTSFKILFPATDQPTTAFRQEPSANTHWQGKGTILLVDDEETVRVIGKKMLERHGFTVLTACDGREALTIYQAQSEDIDCVVLDLTMPHMDGEETYRELRRFNKNVRVLLSSGYNEEEVSQRFIGKGLSGFIQKPYQTGQLLDKLKRILANGMQNAK